MSLIFSDLTIGILLVHLLALSQFSGWSDRHLGRASIILFLVLVLFFVEHFIGLGKLNLLWPFTISISLFLLRKELVNPDFWLKEMPFLIPFALALLWRGRFPDIDTSAESMTDLYFVSNFITGHKLPPPDMWLPNHLFDSYYALMHYAAALIGRLLNLGAGWSMNLGFCVLTGLLGSLVWSMASKWVTKTHWKVLIVFSIIVGGNGVSPLLNTLFSGKFDANTAQTQLWANTRFIGSYDKKITSTWGSTFYNNKLSTPDQTSVKQDLPLETVGYYLYIGDYHPPLGGFLLLFMALSLISLIENTTHHHTRFLFVLGMTVPATIAVNAWVFPLHFLLVISWLAWRYFKRRSVKHLPLILGVVFSLLLLYPFLGYFSEKAVSTPIRWVSSTDRTPIIQWFSVWWPALLLIILSWWRHFREKSIVSSLGAWASMAILAVLVGLEFVYFDDNLSGCYNRFNTVLKWWSWLYPVAIALLSALLLGVQGKHIQNKITRTMVVLTLLAVSSYILPQIQYLFLAASPSVGQFAGDAWLNSDPINHALLRYLKVAPQGVVLEGLEGGAYMISSALALHSGNGSANGWPDHVLQWRNTPEFVKIDANNNKSFYHGTLDMSLSWLKRLNVRYIVWSSGDQVRDPKAFPLLQKQLAGDYDWNPLIRKGGVEYGVWVARIYSNQDFESLKKCN